MTQPRSLKSFLNPPSRSLVARFASWALEEWRNDPRPFLLAIGTVLAGTIAAFFDLSTGWFMILWLTVVFGVAFFGLLYFIWNIASIAIILLIERKFADETEKAILNYWLRRNIIITVIWAGILLGSIFMQPGWSIVATLNTVVLISIILFTKSEESPFETGQQATDSVLKEREST